MIRATLPYLKTEIPGPESLRMTEAAARVEPGGVKRQVPVVWKRARGVMVEDVDGNIFLDFTSSVLVANIGHNHPRLVSALKDQIDENLHSYNFLNPSRLELAEKLVRLAPDHIDRVFFVTTGAEAIELAVNAVKCATGKTELLSFWGGYHGKTYGALSLGGKSSSRKGLGPAMPGVLHAPYPYCYRCPMGKSRDNCGTSCFDFTLRMLEAEGCRDLGAIIMEPFQGASGQIEPPVEFVERLEKWRKENGIVLIMDEVQASFGRTGRMFAFEHFGIAPDVVVAGKGISSGVPLTAILGSSKILDAAPAGSLSSTHGGNPVATKAASVAVDVIVEENLAGNASKVGAHLIGGLEELRKEFPILGDVRGRGLMIGLEIVAPDGSNEPAPELALKVVEAAVKRGLLMIKPIGFYGNVIRCAPPLVMTTEEADAGLSILKEAFAEVSGSEQWSK